MDVVSDILEVTGIGNRIATRVRDLRAAQGLSLDALAARSGVSRSMISLVERGETSPTAVVLERLASGLGVVLASLFDRGAGTADAAAGPVARRAEQPLWRDPATGYLRRNVSPSAATQPFRIVGVRFPPGERVVFENGAGGRTVHQQVWILEGSMDITVDDDLFHLHEGDCMAMQLDRPTTFHNPTGKAARYAVVIAQPGVMR